MKKSVPVLSIEFRDDIFIGMINKIISYVCRYFGNLILLLIYINVEHLRKYLPVLP